MPELARFAASSISLPSVPDIDMHPCFNSDVQMSDVVSNSDNDIPSSIFGAA